MPQGLHSEQSYDFGHDRPIEAAAGSNGQIAPAAEVRVAIVSAVRLVRESLSLNLRERDGINVIDAVGLDPQEIVRIATAAPDVVLVDLGRTEPAAISALFKV